MKKSKIKKKSHDRVVTLDRVENFGSRPSWGATRKINLGRDLFGTRPRLGRPTQVDNPQHYHGHAFES